MAEGAIALAAEARGDPEAGKDAKPELWPDAVAASDRVAAYILPKLKAVEHRGEDGGPLAIILASKDAAL